MSAVIRLESFKKDCLSISRLVITPKTRPQKGEPMFRIGSPANVTRKATKAPDVKPSPNEIWKADCNVRSKARPASVLRKAVGVAISRFVTAGAKAPNKIAITPSITPPIHCRSLAPLETSKALEGPVRHVDTHPKNAATSDPAPHIAVNELTGGECPADRSMMIP